MVARTPLAGIHEIALRIGGEPDAAVDRRCDVGVAEVLLRDGHGGLVLQHARLGAFEIGAILIEERLRNRLVLQELQASIEGELGIQLLSLRGGEIGLGLIQAGLVLRLLDLVEQVAGLDVLPFREQHLLEESLHTCAKLHGVGGLDAADERIGAGDALHFGGPDADGGRRRRRRGLRLRLFSTSCEQGDEEGCRKKARRPRPPLAASDELTVSFRSAN